MDIPEKIDLLFRTVTKPDGQEYSYREVEDLTGGVVSSTSIWKMRTGKTQNPTQRTLRALSKAFQVPISFFFKEYVSPDEIQRYHENYRADELVEQIALRSNDLDNEGKRAILDMINYVREAQGLGGNNRESRFGRRNHRSADMQVAG